MWWFILIHIWVHILYVSTFVASTWRFINIQVDFIMWFTPFSTVEPFSQLYVEPVSIAQPPTLPVPWPPSVCISWERHRSGFPQPACWQYAHECTTFLNCQSLEHCSTLSKGIFQRHGDRLYQCSCVGLWAGAAASGTTTGTCFTPACASCLRLKSNTHDLHKQQLHKRRNIQTVCLHGTVTSLLTFLFWQRRNLKQKTVLVPWCRNCTVTPPGWFTSANDTVILTETEIYKTLFLCPDSRFFMFMFTKVFS